MLVAMKTIEENYAGFRVKRNENNDYENQKAFFIKESRQRKYNKQEYCVYLMMQWLKTFEDRHLQIRKNSQAHMIFSGATEALSGENERKEELRKLKGEIFHKDGVDLLFLKNKNSFRDYIGVVLRSYTTAWKAGDIIMEVKEVNGRFEGFEYDSKMYINPISYHRTNAGFGPWKLGEEKEVPTNRDLPDLFSRKLLAPDILYLKVGSFNQKYHTKIDSLFNNQLDIPNLIIDIRGNGGGADFVYDPILPYLYTGPIKVIGVDVYSTELNIRLWEKLLEMKDLPKETIDDLYDIIGKMKKYHNEYASIIDDEIIALSEKPSSKQVVILANKETGSTAEQFLLAAKQSNKVTIIGQNSAGVLDYANVRGTDIGFKEFSLFYPTTISRRIYSNQGIDNIGIAPHIRYGEEEDLIEKAVEIIRKTSYEK